MLRVAGCGLRIAGYALRVTRCGLRVAGYALRVTRCGLRVAGCALRVKEYSEIADRQKKSITFLSSIPNPKSQSINLVFISLQLSTSALIFTINR